MMTLAARIPDVELLLALPPEEIGAHLLALAATNLRNGIFAPGAITGSDYLFGSGFGSQPGPFYSDPRSAEIELAVAEAWLWLEHNALIMPAPSPNDSFKRFTRRGRELVNNAAGFKNYVSAARFPKSALHTSIADEVWLQLSQGNYPVAVFIAFRAVEESVRNAAGFAQDEHGVPMVRRAFHKDSGPLRRPADPDAEREALSSLFAGALGSYKNPHSHRAVALDDPQEAQEMVVLASHLLRIVEARTRHA